MFAINIEISKKKFRVLGEIACESPKITNWIASTAIQFFLIRNSISFFAPSFNELVHLHVNDS